jgi:hypothetical protein
VAATRTDHGQIIIGYDDEGNPIYGEAPKKETGKSFNDAIKDLFWDVLGREPRPEELSAYSRDFGAKIDPDEEQIFFDRSQQEIQGRNDPILNLYKEATGGREPGLEEYRETRKELGGDISAEERAGFLESYVDPSFKEQYKTLSPSDPVYRLFSQELGRKPTLQEYRQFEGTFGATPTEQQRRAVRAVDPEVYGTRLIDQYRYMTGGQDPSEAQRRLVYQGGQENFTPQNLGEYLASQNLAGRDRYAPSVAPCLAVLMTQCKEPVSVWLSRSVCNKALSHAAQAQVYRNQCRLAGQRITRHRHQPLGANYIGAPTNIAPITQGFQPVGQPSVPSYYPQSFQPMGGRLVTVPTAVTDSKFGRLHSQPTQHVAVSPLVAAKGGRQVGVKHAYVCTSPAAFRALTGKG